MEDREVHLWLVVGRECTYHSSDSLYICFLAMAFQDQSHKVYTAFIKHCTDMLISS